MPTYEYACTACDEQIEVVQRFTDPPLSDCPACSGRLRKVFSPVGVVFKGSGFYKTDSRSRSSASSSSASTPSSDSAPAAPAADAKPAPASDTKAAPAETPKSSGAPAA